MNKLKEAKEIS